MEIKPKPRPLHTLNSSTQEHTDHFISGTEVETSTHQKNSWNIELDRKFEGHTTTKRNSHKEEYKTSNRTRRKPT